MPDDSHAQFAAQQLVKTLSCLAFPPGFMTAVVEQDETKVGDYRRERITYSRGGMRIVVTVNGHHRVVDTFGGIEQRAGITEPCSLGPDCMEDVRTEFGGGRNFIWERIIRIGLRHQLTETGEGSRITRCFGITEKSGEDLRLLAVLQREPCAPDRHDIHGVLLLERSAADEDQFRYQRWMLSGGQQRKPRPPGMPGKHNRFFGVIADCPGKLLDLSLDCHRGLEWFQNPVSGGKITGDRCETACTAGTAMHEGTADRRRSICSVCCHVSPPVNPELLRKGSCFIEELLAEHFDQGDQYRNEERAEHDADQPPFLDADEHTEQHGHRMDFAEHVDQFGPDDVI